MKIREPGRDKKLSSASKKQNTRAKAVSKAFPHLLEEKEEKLALAMLQEMLKSIEEKGEKLKKSRNLKDLKAYKKDVKNFLATAGKEGLKVRQISHRTPQGKMKIYTVIDKVDDALEELTQEMLKKQASVMSIVAKIDEIRGLLLDLFI